MGSGGGQGDTGRGIGGEPAGPLPHSDVAQTRPFSAWWLCPPPGPPDMRSADCPGLGARGPDVALALCHLGGVLSPGLSLLICTVKESARQRPPRVPSTPKAKPGHPRPKMRTGVSHHARLPVEPNYGSAMAGRPPDWPLGIWEGSACGWWNSSFCTRQTAASDFLRPKSTPPGQDSVPPAPRR